MKLKRNWDAYIVFAVFLQFLLVILQHSMVLLFGISESITTTFRVVSTIVVLVPAIIISFRRKPLLWIIVYLLAVLVLLLNVVCFPENESYLEYDALRFTLPTVIPSALCLMTISDVDIMERILLKLSWIAFVFSVLYLGAIIIGVASIYHYNMSYGYALLLPAITLYSQKTRWSIIASLIMIFSVLAIGSRGPLLIFLAYITIDMMQRSIKMIPFFIVLVVILLVILPQIEIFLESKGIYSRTLQYAMEGELSQDSGRSRLLSMMKDALMQNFWGIGLWGDRTLLDGLYCHNILYEIIGDFGWLVGWFIIGLLAFYIIRCFVFSDKQNRIILTKYICALLIYLFASGSYLTSYNFGAFLGILYLFNKSIG